MAPLAVLLAVVGALLPVLSFARMDLSASGPVKLCGGREVSLPGVGSWGFQVTAKVDNSGSGGERGFSFRVDRDLHVAWCGGSVADPATGRLTKYAPCLSEVLAKYALTDVELEVASNEPGAEKVRLSAAASPMGFTLGRMRLELSAEGCNAPSEKAPTSDTPAEEDGAPAHIGL